MHGTDHFPAGLHCSLGVLINLLSRLRSAALVLELKLAFRLLPLVTRPIRGAHELSALLLGVPVAFFEQLLLLLLLTSHDEPEWLPLVVHVVVGSWP